MITAQRRAEIERTIRGMHHEIIQGAKLRHSAGLPPYPQLFSPDAAIEKYGYSFEVRDAMPVAHAGSRYQTAGMIDTEQRLVVVSSDLTFETQRFTTAHELGHLVLHETMPGMRLHRDRPVTGESAGAKDPIEAEADYFAAVWLSPGRTVEHYFRERFGAIPLTLNETTAFHVAGFKGVADLMASPATSLAFPIAVARATSFNGRRFESLARYFGLSPTAMGIRLRELRLIAY